MNEAGHEDALRALRESEERFASFAASSSDALWIRDAKTYVFQYVSPAVESIYGVRAEQVLADQELINDLILPEQRGPISANVARIAQGEKIVHEYQIKRRTDGAIRWIRSTGFPLRNADGRVGRIGAIAQDITEQRLTDEALRESEAKYRTLFDGMAEGYLVADVIFEAAGKPIDIEYVASNAAAIRMVGVDLTGKRLRAVSADYEDYWYEIWGRVAVTGKSERAVRFASPEQIWYDFNVFKLEPENADSRRVAVLFQDVTARKRDEVALQESVERREQALEATELGTFVWHVQEDRGEPDARMLALFDQPPDGGLNLRDALATMIHPDDRPRYAAAVAEAARPEGTRELREDIRVRRAEGGWRWLEIRARIAFDEAGQALRMAGTALDITARKDAEAALRESEDKFRTLFEGLDEGLSIQELIFDSEGRVVDWIYREANSAFEQQGGFPNPYGLKGSEVVPRVDQRVLDLMDRVARTGEPERSESYIADIDRHIRFQTSRVGGAGSRLLAVVFEDVTDRRRSEAALRESEERKAFLLKLSDAVRSLASPADIQGETTRLLREQFNAAWCYYVDWELDRKMGLVLRDSAREGLPSLAGAHDVSDAPEFLQLLQSAGDVLTVRDYASYEQLPTSIRQNFVALGFRSMVVAPLVKEGRLIASLLVGDTAVRDWSPREAQLLAEVAERTWAAVERARAEEALRLNEEELRVALEAGRMGTYRLDLRTGTQSWSEKQYDIFGVPRGTEPTRDLFLSLVHPEDHHLIEFSLDDIRQPGTFLDSEFRITRPDGELRWITAHALALFDRGGHPIGLIGVNHDVTERRQLEAAMHSSEERLRQFGETSSDVMWIRRADNLQWEYLSPAFHKIYGISRQDALRGDNYLSWQNLIVDEDRDAALACIERVRQGERATFQYRVRRPEDGQIRWLRNTDFPMRDEAGNVVRIGGIGHDITPLKLAEEHQRLLTAELQHRVRNTLAVIRSIARRTAASSDSVEDFAMNLEGRIDAFARVQSVVTRNPAGGVDLAMLVAEELRAASANEGDALRIDGPDVALKPKPAETLALGVHELATNAIKHGALHHSGGRISVTWLRDNEGVRMRWKETGLHLNGVTGRAGLGTEILTRTLPYELGAKATFLVEPDGVMYELLLPSTIFGA